MPNKLYKERHDIKEASTVDAPLHNCSMLKLDRMITSASNSYESGIERSWVQQATSDTRVHMAEEGAKAAALHQPGPKATADKIMRQAISSLLASKNTWPSDFLVVSRGRAPRIGPRFKNGHNNLRTKAFGNKTPLRHSL